MSVSGHGMLPLAVRPRGWEGRSTRARELRYSILVAEAFKDEQRCFRLACGWFGGGLLSVAVLIAGNWITGLLPHATGLVRAPGVILLVLGGAGFLISPFGFLFGMASWLAAMKRRRRIVEPGRLE